jgi:hypothetical protein
LTYCSFPAGLTKSGRRQVKFQLQNGLTFTAMSFVKSGSVYVNVPDDEFAVPEAITPPGPRVA